MNIVARTGFVLEYKDAEKNMLIGGYVVVMSGS